MTLYTLASSYRYDAPYLVKAASDTEVELHRLLLADVDDGAPQARPARGWRTAAALHLLVPSCAMNHLRPRCLA